MTEHADVVVHIEAQCRGHPMRFDGSTQEWRYKDTGEAVKDRWRERPCGRCGEATDDGHDPCIAKLPGVKNACCGHGDTAEAYAQFEDGRRLGGKDAEIFFASVLDEQAVRRGRA